MSSNRSRRLDVVVLTDSVMFASRIRETLGPLGYGVASIERVEELPLRLAEQQADLLVLDLSSVGGFVEEALATARDVAPGMPVLAFGRHTEPRLLRAARQAGCTEVVVRSKFVEEMPRLVERCLRRARRSSHARA